MTQGRKIELFRKYSLGQESMTSNKESLALCMFHVGAEQRRLVRITVEPVARSQDATLWEMCEREQRT